MRHVPLLLLSLCATTAFSQEARIQSSVSVALKLTNTGVQTFKQAKNSTVIRSAQLEEVRLGNRDILEDMLADQELPTQSIRGWKIIAVWANWSDANPYAGNGYRFFAVCGKGASQQVVAVSPHYLAMKPVKATVGYTVTTEGETVTGGRETFSVLSEVDFGIEGHAGELTGIHTGSGRYVRPKNGNVTHFVPGANKVVLHGAYENPGEEGSGVASGSLTFGAASLVKIPSTEGSSSSSSSSWTSSATLTMAGISAISIDALSGATLNGGSLFLSGTYTLSSQAANYGTLTLTSAATLNFHPLPSTTESLTGTLAVTKPGTLTLGTGETLPLLAGDTLALNTLTLSQLSPLIWTPAP